jgi:methylated-DNA-[protein]-cysteine S-methyltransferase
MNTAKRSRRGLKADAAAAKEAMGRVLFDTPLGRCRIAWSARGITRFELPGHEASGGSGDARALSPLEALGQDVPPSDAPDWVREAMAMVALHLGGNPQDLGGVPIDMEGVSPFFQRVYAIARTIPAGETLSYAELADRAGSPKAFRAVGQAMAKNPFPVLVPCHRVLAAGGKLGGFSAPGGTATKVRLLDLER